MWKIRGEETAQRSYLKNLNQFINFSWEREKEKKKDNFLFFY